MFMSPQMMLNMNVHVKYSYMVTLYGRLKVHFGRWGVGWGGGEGLSTPPPTYYSLHVGCSSRAEDITNHTHPDKAYSSQRLVYTSEAPQIILASEL